MGNKVIHISDEIHHVVQAHCTRLKIRMTDWASNVLREAAKDKTPIPIAKKKIQPAIKGVQAYDSDPWGRPPFWAGQRAKKDRNSTKET